MRSASAMVSKTITIIQTKNISRLQLAILHLWKAKFNNNGVASIYVHFSNKADKSIIHESGLQTSVSLKGDTQTHTLKTWPWSVCVFASQKLFCSLSLFMAEQIINEKQDEFCFSWRAQTHSTPPLLTRPRFEELIWTICMQMTCHFSFDIYHFQWLCICKSVLKISVWSDNYVRRSRNDYSEMLWNSVVIMCVHRPFLFTDEDSHNAWLEELGS